MRKPQTVLQLDDLGRTQLSPHFFLRDFLHSEIASFYRLANVPDDPVLAITAGRRLCQDLLEPLQDAFGRVAIRSGYRSAEVNATGHAKGHNCASNEASAAGHIWDLRDAGGHMGASACVVVPGFANRFRGEGDWQRLAWWIHDHLPYATLEFFPKLWAFTVGWHERPRRMIYSHVPDARGYLTKPGMANHDGDHRAEWEGIVPDSPSSLRA